MILGVAGHRPNRLGGHEPCALHEWVRQQLRVALVALRPERLLVGMALGTDQWACSIALELGIPYVAVVPFESYHRPWPPAAQVHYQRLLRRAFQCVLATTGELQGRHGRIQALLRRSGTAARMAARPMRLATLER